MLINQDLDLSPQNLETEIKRRIAYHIFADRDILRKNEVFIDRYHDLPWKERYFIGGILNYMRKQGIIFNYQSNTPLRYFIENVGKRGGWYKALGNPINLFHEKLQTNVREVNKHAKINQERQATIVDCLSELFDGLNKFIKQAEEGLPLDINGTFSGERLRRDLTFAERLEQYLADKEKSKKTGAHRD